MLSSSALLELHRRTHRCLQGLLDHCAEFSSDELGRELDGFGYPTLLLQLHHAIGAERYWVGVLRGLLLADEDEADRGSVTALRAFRERVAADTATYLEAVSDEELRTPQRVTTWGGKETEVVPAWVLLRTQMHVFQHKGQVAAMARLLGRPVPAGLDFPLT